MRKGSKATERQAERIVGFKVPFRFIKQNYDTAYMAELEARRPPNSTPSSEPVPH